MRRLFKYLFVAVGTVAILLAVGLGLFRLLIAQIPDYQTELKAWVADELGLEVDFEMLDARLGLRGPELTLRDSSIGGSDGVRFLFADEAAITLDPAALVLGRRIEISRLTLGGVELTVVRDPAGVFHVGDFAFEPGQGNLANVVPESVEVVIRDSMLRYVDRGSERTWDFSDLFLTVEATASGLEGRATLRPPEALAGRVELDLAADRGPAAAGGRWTVEARAGSLGLEALAQLVPVPGLPRVAGNGAVEARIVWAGQTLETIRLGVDLESLTIGTAGDDAFDRVRFVADWRRPGENSWSVELAELDVTRGDRSWAQGAPLRFTLATDDFGIRAVELATGFVRLDDLEPIVSAFPETQIAEQWALFDPVGDVRDLEFSLERVGDSIVYDLDAGFAGIAVQQVGTTPGIAGMSGRVQASEDSGTIEFLSGPLVLDWPLLFPRVVDAESLTGAVVWRQGRDVVQILSVDLGIGVLDEVARASFDLRLPRDGSSPTLELDAELAEVALVPAKDYLPAPIMPAAVVDWLEMAVTGGRGRNVELEFFGPLESFPFDDGAGLFRVEADIEEATLNYMDGWPVAEALEGRISFVNAGFFASGAGRVLTNEARTAEIAIPDMRTALMTLAVESQGPLAGVVDYLRGVPLIASHLGPDFSRIVVAGGTGAIDVDLELPLNELSAYGLDAAVTIGDGELEIDGLKPAIEAINGTIRADEAAVSARDVEAVFLGGPVVASLERSERPGYRAVLTVEGETSAEAAAESFSLPHGGLLGGQTLWRGELLLPSLDPLATVPAAITVESNLAGVALRFPEPLTKPPSEPVNLRLDFRFPGNRLEVAGNIGASRRFRLDYQAADAGYAFSRGAIEFGGDEPRLPIQPGLIVSGQVEAVALDEWLALAGGMGMGLGTSMGAGTGTGAGTGAGASSAGAGFLGADVEIGEFRAYGQQLGATALRVTRSDTAWDVVVDSSPIAGRILVPRDVSRRQPIVADMERVYLASGNGSGADVPEGSQNGSNSSRDASGDSSGSRARDSSGTDRRSSGALDGVDPATLPGLELEAAAFAVGTRRLGSVSAVLEADPQGLRLTRFSSRSANLQAELSGSWLRRPRGTRTTVEAAIRSTDVRAALAELGIDPVIDGEVASVEANVYWDSAPTAGWLEHLNGDVSLFVETGTLREVDPGAGRVLGLMSIAALPRRLLLDFRDVFEEGFAFDEIRGDFLVVDGDAYTDNLLFDGPAAEIGVVGRTGLRDRDYRQQIVVTAEPGNMLPTVGGLLGGAGVGAALFVFTRLFKEPLKGIGRASYCLTGSWEEPAIEPLDEDESEQALRCAELPAEMLEEITDD